MTRQDYIKLYKRNGFALVEHSEFKDKESDPAKQYIPAYTVESFQQAGWVRIPDVEVPEEAAKAIEKQGKKESK